ncbi:MAG: hypothetical protein WC389_11780 [Lutibacter sp.]|jgi:hypothetical protein
MDYLLLTKKWGELSSPQRCNAVKEAKKAAVEEAQSDNGAAGGVEQMTANQHVYYTRIVDAGFQQELIDEDTDNEWRYGDHSDDPRVIAFCESWGKYQKEQLDEAIDVASGIAREMLEKGETVHDTFEHVKKVMHPNK